VKVKVFGVLKYIALISGLFFLYGSIVQLNSNDPSIDDVNYIWSFLLTMCCILLAIFFQGEQKR